MLTKEQKIDIIESRIIVIEGSIYHLDLGIIEEQAKTQPSDELINELGRQKSETLLSLAAMTNRLNIVLSE
jgi:hypothetical protein